MLFKSFGVVLGIVASFAVSHVQADEAMVELANQKGCFICHGIKPPGQGVIPLAPSYTDIANRYSKDETVFEELVLRTIQGTVYTKQAWKGRVNMRFMPPNVGLDYNDAAALVHWILQQKESTTHPELVKHDENLALANNAGCMACHRVSKVTDQRYLPLAPSFKEVADHYKGEADKKKLVKNIINGTLNNPKEWENVNMRFMPANVFLNEKDAEILVDWIISLQE